MVDDCEIYRSASAILKQYGEGAAGYVVVRADELLRDGDVESLAKWTRILLALKELLTKERPANATVH